VKALKNFRKASGIGYDPSNERDVDLPVGLKARPAALLHSARALTSALQQNLGATCYVNSFLQVLIIAVCREGRPADRHSPRRSGSAT
jgi:ubiquitin C-terminal hydrolase